MSDKLRAIEILRHAHDHIWSEKSRPVSERLAACNVLFDAALSLIPLNSARYFLDLFLPRQER